MLLCIYNTSLQELYYYYTFYLFQLWSRKIFPERYSSSHPTARLYIDPEATGEVRMPLTQAKPATIWTTDELMKDFDEFVQAASEITDFLEGAPARDLK